MKTELIIYKNKWGSEFVSFELFNKVLLLFSENHVWLPPISPDVFYSKVIFTNTTHGNICLSRLKSSDTFEYSKIGTWRKSNNYIFLEIQGKGIFKVNFVFHNVIDVVEIPNKVSDNKWAINQIDYLKSLPFNPDNF